MEATALADAWYTTTPTTATSQSSPDEHYAAARDGPADFGYGSSPQAWGTSFHDGPTAWTCDGSAERSRSRPLMVPRLSARGPKARTIAKQGSGIAAAGQHVVKMRRPPAEQPVFEHAAGFADPGKLVGFEEPGRSAQASMSPRAAAAGTGAIDLQACFAQVQASLEAMERRLLSEIRSAECSASWSECKELLSAVAARQGQAASPPAGDTWKGEDEHWEWHQQGDEEWHQQGGEEWRQQEQGEWEWRQQEAETAGPLMTELRDLLAEFRDLKSEQKGVLSARPRPGEIATELADGKDAVPSDSSDDDAEADGSVPRSDVVRSPSAKAAARKDVWQRELLEVLDDISLEGADQRTSRLHKVKRCVLAALGGEPDRDGCPYRVSRSSWFQWISLLMTFTNCVLAAMEADSGVAEALRSAMAGEPYVASDFGPDTTTVILQRVFVAWLMLELVLQLVGTRSDFFFGPEWHWNAFDVVILCISVFAMFGDIGGSSSYVRAVRIAKITRAVRAVRFVRFSESLQRMMAVGVSVMVSLVWAACLFAIFAYVCGVMMMEGIVAFASELPASTGALSEKWRGSQFFSPHTGADDRTLPETLQMHYGGLGRTLVTLLRAVSGADWGSFAAPMYAMDEIWGLVWVLYVCGAFGIITVAVAIVVNIVRRPQTIDHEMSLGAEVAEEQALAHRFAHELVRCGLEPDMKLSQKTFLSFVHSRSVSRTLKAYGVEIERIGSSRVFHLIDIDNKGHTTIHEAARRFLMLRGEAKSEDMTRLVSQLRSIQGQMMIVADAICEIRFKMAQRQSGIPFVTDTV